MLIRVRASRAPYRRAGLKFSEAKAWQEVEVSEFDLGRIIQLAADPVVSIERQEEDDSWTPMPEELRQAARDFVTEHGISATDDEEWLALARAALSARDIDSEGPTGAPALADGTQSLGASGEATCAPSDEAAAGKTAASDAPPAEKRKARPAR